MRWGFLLTGKASSVIMRCFIFLTSDGFFGLEANIPSYLVISDTNCCLCSCDKSAPREISFQKVKNFHFQEQFVAVVSLERGKVFQCIFGYL